MRIGLMSGAGGGSDGTIEGLIARCKDLEARGFDSVWMANIFGLDAIGSLGIVGRETERIELGTAVVPSYPRHPVAMAQQALTTQAASGGRFVLGIGLSHQIVIESMLGLSYAKPARHMREYLSVLVPLLQKENVAFQGDEYQVSAALDVSDASPVPVMIAALGDHMLRIAGSSTAGTILWMTGPQTIESHIGPKLRQAASEAGRPEPRIVAGFPTVVTDDPDAVRGRIGEALTMYGTLPSYRAMLDREGVAGPAEVALVGNEKALDQELDRLRDIGVTDFNAAVMPFEEGADARTLDYLQSRLGA
jgi:F420-dependent oxidoreductase-like protein